MERDRSWSWALGVCGSSTLVGVLVCACGVSEPAPSIGSAEAALAQPGPWQIPPDVEAEGERQAVTYTGAGPCDLSRCAPGPTPGAVEFKAWILASFPQVWHVGGYACRCVNNTVTPEFLSMHATGRALDMSVYEASPGEADNDAGDAVGNWLILHAEEIGLQRIIWDRWNWHAARSPRSGSYGGSVPHTNHLHVELSVAGSRMETPWFSGPRLPPGPSLCGAAIPPEGGSVDDSDACFTPYGSSTYWRSVAGEGEGGSLLWTNAFANDAPGNWAQWRFHFERAGRYRVEVDSAAAYAVWPTVRYQVVHAGGSDDVVIDPAGATGYHSLGEFDFAVDEPYAVSVYDNYPAPVGADQHITVDAVRISPVVMAMDAGGPDAGTTMDAGTPRSDAGTTADAGTTLDAGVTLDAGAGDAGTDADAGTPRGDAGPGGGLDRGCSCRVDAPARGTNALWLVALLALAWRRRRCGARLGRRSSSTPKRSKARRAFSTWWKNAMP